MKSSLDKPIRSLLELPIKIDITKYKNNIKTIIEANEEDIYVAISDILSSSYSLAYEIDNQIEFTILQQMGMRGEIQDIDNSLRLNFEF